MTTSAETGGRSMLIRAIESWLFPVVAAIPVPHRVILPYLLKDNAAEAEDGWARLSDPEELGRYWAVRGAVHEFARGGDVLDVGCARGLLLDGLDCRSYTGVDLFPEALPTGPPPAHARFVAADVAEWRPDEPFDAIVFNECLYYLRDPLGVMRALGSALRPGGVMVVSVFDRSWATRRIARQVDQVGPVLAHTRVVAASGPAWTVKVIGAPGPTRAELDGAGLAGA